MEYQLKLKSMDHYYIIKNGNIIGEIDEHNLRFNKLNYKFSEYFTPEKMGVKVLAEGIMGQNALRQILTQDNKIIARLNYLGGSITPPKKDKKYKNDEIIIGKEKYYLVPRLGIALSAYDKDNVKVASINRNILNVLSTKYKVIISEKIPLDKHFILIGFLYKRQSLREAGGISL